MKAMSDAKRRYKICVFVPEAAKEQVKSAMFAAGAGKIGNYDCCAWEVLGLGQFRPLQGSQPHIGTLNQVETVAEYRLEMICLEPDLQSAIKAMRQAHPYEEPAYDVILLAH
jgi:hypothetical protein